MAEQLFTVKPKEISIRTNAEITPAEAPSQAPTEKEQFKANAERFVAMVTDQRDVLAKNNISLNEGFEAANFLIRRNILDKLLDPRHDIDRECGYPQDILPTMYHMMYMRDGISRRVVRVLPEESWAVDPEITEKDDSETPFMEALNEVIERLNLWYMLERVDILSGVSRFGVLLLGLGDGKDMSEPVEGINEFGEKQGDTENELLFLRAFDETVVRVNMREENVMNPRFGKPTVYTVTFKDLDITERAGSGIATVGDVTKKVHWTRIIHVADNREMSEVYGVPRMKPVFNRLMDIRKILSGSGEMFWKGAFPGISFELMPGVGANDVDMATLKKQIEGYQAGLTRYIATAGMKANSLPPQIEDPTAHLDKQIENVCITLGIPKRIFMGSEEAKLASSQDSKTWNRRIGKRQNKYATPMIIRELVDRLIAIGVVPEPKEYQVTWQDLNTVTDGERADVALKRTQALAAYVAGDVAQIVPPDHFLEVVMEMDEDRITDILAAAEEAAELEEQEPKDAHVDGAGKPGDDGADTSTAVAEAATDQAEQA